MSKNSAKAQTKQESKAGTGNVAGMPLFFGQPRALDSKRHAKASVQPSRDMAFAKDTNSVPVNAIEFIEAAKHYPIVFSAGDESVPAIITGLEQNNYFVNGKGSWKEGTYVPAYVRQYPFIFFEETEQKKFYLCVDEKSPLYNESDKESAASLYTAAGEPSGLTQNALQFCTAFYNHYLITRNFCADLKKHNLLKPYHSEATLGSGKKISLGGFQMIDETTLNALPDDVFNDFRKKGWLPFIYFAMASSSNWKNLVHQASLTEK